MILAGMHTKRFSKQHSKYWTFKVSLIVIINTVLFLWLYNQTITISNVQHLSFIQNLRDINEADALIDKEVLATHTRFSKNYDALAFYSNQIEIKLALIKQLPDFLSKKENKSLQKALTSFTQIFKNKSHYVDLFKRNNAILINSRNYFISESEKLLQKNELNLQFNRVLNNYIYQTLLYVQNYHLDNLKKSILLHEQLLAQMTQNANIENINNLLKHGDITLKSTTKASQQIRSISMLATVSKYNELIDIYNNIYSKEQSDAQVYFKILVIYSILLVLFVSYLLINLDNIRLLLSKSNKKLKDRYIQQQKIEKLLLLHDTAFLSTQEAIVLTDASGIIIDANPSFSRITGYSKEESIGQNPRVLKSGKHTTEFYQAMWHSINNTGKWQGEIWNRKKSGKIYPENLSITSVKDNQGKVTNYVAVFSDVAIFKEQERQLKQMAFYDALTKLPNRFLLTDRIAQAISQTERSKAYMAICFLDFDGFKPINDTYGHEVGDKLLVEMANRFKNILREGDTVARIGGDEFVFLLVGMNEIKEYE